MRCGARIVEGDVRWREGCTGQPKLPPLLPALDLFYRACWTRTVPPHECWTRVLYYAVLCEVSVLGPAVRCDQVRLPFT